MNDEFYIGWEDKAAPGIRKTVGRTVIVLLLAALLVPAALAVSQHLVGAAIFEWGTVKVFSGVFRATPCPHLLVSRPGNLGAQPGCSAYYLVSPWKFGVKSEVAALFDGQPVTLKGTLIYRGNQTMIEVVDHSIILDPTNTRRLPISPAIPLGKQTLVGEIVDSKCFLGVMNPGQLAPHRACAIRCISGGVPPVLLVRQPDGPAVYLVLVSPDGKPVNQQVLAFVAEPVEITGEVEREGELLILRADPARFRRVAP